MLIRNLSGSSQIIIRLKKPGSFENALNYILEEHNFNYILKIFNKSKQDSYNQHRHTSTPNNARVKFRQKQPVQRQNTYYQSTGPPNFIFEELHRTNTVVLNQN